MMRLAAPQRIAPPGSAQCHRTVAVCSSSGPAGQQCSTSSSSSAAVAAPPAAVSTSVLPRPSTPVLTAAAAAAALAAAAAGTALWRKASAAGQQRQQVRQQQLARQKQTLELSGLIRPARTVQQDDSPEYRMALARTRQAVAVHKAVGYARTGNAARAMVELRRALHENSICRAPILSTMDAAKEDRLALYALHLRNTVEGQGGGYATLLQLRVMLDLAFEEAEAQEAEIQQSAAYDI